MNAKFPPSSGNFAFKLAYLLLFGKGKNHDKNDKNTFQICISKRSFAIFN
jgi:hypothetical protein